MGVVEQKLNEEISSDFPISEIVTEILRLQFAKRANADANDCLLSKCDKIFVRETNRLRNNLSDRYSLLFLLSLTDSL